ncbi:hypothetical protein BDZ85DRAFT_260323 [Elsinoe ampelina]|uniref:Uncharacterized protein n=1 Tax=Elsinoe ampelina TaxID=302913 RepID=A0A6A6GEH4_9PEZI|nr:hypothetical protein BDZ85DRAFT_260323 [Elsinoe ampelina]
MLQYAFYAPPILLSPTTSSSPDAGASRAVSLAASVTSSTATEILRDSPAALTKATRTRKHTPTAPAARKTPPVSASDPVAPTTCNGDGACSPTHAGQNPADRFLEYNIVSHAVRNRAGFQSRFSKSGEIKTVVYTLNGPRWSDNPTLPQADAILGAEAGNAGIKTEQRLEATKGAKLKLTNKPIPPGEAAKRPSRTSISSKKIEEPEGKLPVVKKALPTGTKTRTRTAAQAREPPFGVFSDSAPRKNSIDAEAEALKRHLSESPSAEEHYQSAEEEHNNDDGEERQGHSARAVAKGTFATEGTAKTTEDEGSKEPMSMNGEVPDSEGSETSELTELDSDEMKTPKMF